MYLQQRQILIYLGGLPAVWNEELLNLGTLMLDSDQTLERTQGQQNFNSFLKWNKPQTEGKLTRCTSLPIYQGAKEDAERRRDLNQSYKHGSVPERSLQSGEVENGCPLEPHPYASVTALSCGPFPRDQHGHP